MSTTRRTAAARTGVSTADTIARELFRCRRAKTRNAIGRAPGSFADVLWKQRHSATLARYVHCHESWCLAPVNRVAVALSGRAPRFGREPTMIALKTVLVATDFSEPSEIAVRYGRALAEAFHASLHILHVVPDSMALPWATMADGLAMADVQ